MHREGQCVLTSHCIFINVISFGKTGTDIRDDKKFTYFTLNPKGSITFKTQLVAAYKGSYYLPYTW